MKSYSKPTTEQVDTAIPGLSSPEHERYFFAHLENPLWIAPLAKHGVFKYPPKAERIGEGGIRFPRWGPGSYLARMASKSPAEVAAILAGIETDNPSVMGNVVEAALAMPPDVATSLVPVIARAARDRALWIHFKDASELCICLAEGGEVDDAMELADALFTPAFEEGKEEPWRHDEYWYKDGLKKVAPILVGVSARKSLPKLCDWLKAAVEAKKHVNPGSGEDHSDFWRPAIELESTEFEAIVISPVWQSAFGVSSVRCSGRSIVRSSG